MSLLRKSIYEGQVDEYQVGDLAGDLFRLLSDRTFSMVVVTIGDQTSTATVRLARLHQVVAGSLRCSICPAKSASLFLDYQVPGGHGIPHSGMFKLIDLNVSMSPRVNYMHVLSRDAADFTTPWVRIDEIKGVFEFRSRVDGRNQMVIIILDPLGDDAYGR